MCELHLTRVYRAPRGLVWQVWTDPAHLIHWWGPRGFSLTHHSKDLRVGGSWVYTMHGPDGVDYPNTTTYLEVIEGEKLVYDHGSDGQSQPLFRVTVTFAEVPEGTQMDLTMAFESEEVARAMGEVIRKAGGYSTWDRLAEYLEKQAEGAECFVIHRSFAAPRELVFKLWTQTRHLTRWLATTGATMEYLEADIRPGGRAHLRMDYPGGTLYARVEYHRMEEPELLTYTQVFSDPGGGPGRHPSLAVFPERLHTSVQFAQEGPGQTRVCVTCRPEGEVSAEELAAFLGTRG
ncbi:MAG: SRPBCC domain-containing protein, partial [Verrucomicrobiae bacterium]|nr:SRPBCC domain-containing protein [Verrucomicrobiae bacterium]